MGYRTNRSSCMSASCHGQEVPKRLLNGYNADVVVNGLTHVGNMAHARRKFSEAVKAQGKEKTSSNACRGLALIKKMYRVESKRGSSSLKRAMIIACGMRARSLMSFAPGWMGHCRKRRERVRPVTR